MVNTYANKNIEKLKAITQQPQLTASESNILLTE